MSGHLPSGPTGIGNAQLLEELYDKYRNNPENVDPSWKHFFDGMEFALERPQRKEVVAPSDLRIHHLITAYRKFGHLLAQVNCIDPNPISEVPELRLEMLGFQEAELQTPFPTCGLLPEEEAPLQAIVTRLQEIYCGSIGFEYMGLQSTQMEAWLQERIEKEGPQLTIDQKKIILQELNKAELFEIFLHTKYVGQKRFSLEGGETLIPVLQAVIETGADNGMEEFVIGMAHRGRLSVLANILNKPYGNIFHEFEDTLVESSFEGSGDVKYHKGHSSDTTTFGGKSVHLSITANPSHLESVDPVAQGQVRAKQILKGDDKAMKRIAPVIIHGDASVAGQGVVYETLQMCALPGYGVGGSIHVVVNNQIGFTTLPKDERSTRYCTDIARTFSAPVFHVNAEDPEKCYWAAQLAVQLRQKFHCDVFIDINCYRKYGHNEADEPAFTQPLEYQIIRSKKSTREIYRDDLIQQGIVEREMAQALEEEFKAGLQKELDEVQTIETTAAPDRTPPMWKAIREANKTESPFVSVRTAVPAEKLQELAKIFCTPPAEFNLHRKIKKLADDRLKMVQQGIDDKSINWGMAEHLAYAALLDEDVHVRLAGQDSRRGTFSHRHAMWIDQKTGEKYFPLNHIKEKRGRFDVFNSPLSEYAALGFEFGYSLSNPQALVLWEAQFGDFANGAQIIIDQYIFSCEQKWDRFSGLVCLLPHGYEGQGPEHSSARMERFLQQAGQNNITVANVSTPAQIFHLLRWQALRQARKPLIICTPKQLFGRPECVSSLRDLSEGSFQQILDDVAPPANAKQIVLCSGRLYYDLVAEREKRGANDTAIIRVEQLYPLHEELLKKIVEQYKGFGRLMWVQEEPENMGAWQFMRPRLRALFDGIDPEAVCRPRSASPATGSPRKHKAQQAAIMDKVFG